MRFLQYTWLRFKRVVKRLARSSGSTRSIALGVSIGLFIGMAPIMGIQMVVAVSIATMLRVSKLGAVLPVWITNPVTFVPVYGFNYWLGHVLTGWGPSLADYKEALRRALAAGENEPGFWRGLWVSVVDGSKELAAQGWDAFWAFVVGCTVAGLVCAVVAYPITYRVIDRIRRYRAEKRARRAARLAAANAAASAPAAPADAAPPPAP